MKRLTVIVPVFNECSHLEQVVEYLLTSKCPIQRQWIFVDDGSSDGSTEILEKASSRWGFKLIKQGQQRGKGAALIAGLKEATGDFVVFQDADFEYDPEDHANLLDPLLKDQADAVYGSRFKKGSPHVHRTYHYFVNRFLTEISNLLSGIYLTDMETCFKMFKADFIKSMNLSSQHFGIEVEVTAYLAKTRARIFEVPISYYPRTRLQGKKIKWTDGLAALYHLLKFNWFRSLDKAFTNLPQQYLVGRHIQRPSKSIDKAS